jgi:hypothetical protein
VQHHQCGDPQEMNEDDESLRPSGGRIERHAGDRRIGSENGLRPLGRALVRCLPCIDLARTAVPERDGAAGARTGLRG